MKAGVVCGFLSLLVGCSSVVEQGDAYVAQNELIKAEALYEEALQDPSTCGEAAYRLGVLYLSRVGEEKEHYLRSAELFSQAIKCEYSNEAVARIFRAEAYLKAGENLRALQDLEYVIDRQPNLYHAKLLRAQCNAGLGNSAAAIEDLAECLTQSDERHWQIHVRHALAIELCRVGRYEEARGVWQELSQLDGMQQEDFYWEGVAAYAMGDFAAARVSWQNLPRDRRQQCWERYPLAKQKVVSSTF